MICNLNRIANDEVRGSNRFLPPSISHFRVISEKIFGYTFDYLENFGSDSRNIVHEIWDAQREVRERLNVLEEDKNTNEVDLSNQLFSIIQTIEFALRPLMGKM